MSVFVGAPLVKFSPGRDPDGPGVILEPIWAVCENIHELRVGRSP